MRLGLAIRAFFAILFGRPPPVDLAVYAAQALPEPNRPKDQEPEAARDEPSPDPTPEPEPEPEPEPAPVDDTDRVNAAAVQVLSVLQAEGRLLDFLSEDIDGYDDEDVGAAVRDIHKGLKKAIADHFPVAPLRDEEEDAPVTIPAGFDATQVRLVGNVVGEPPFSGTLKHRGWRVQSVRLPRLPEGDAAEIATPAEVEI
jgi:hypothetical protein